MAIIEAQGLRVSHGKSVALNGIDLNLEEGRILGVIGPNGAGKTSLFSALLGFTLYDGRLSVLGCEPWKERGKLMLEAAFVPDVAVLPRWMEVGQALDFMAGVHPRFDRAAADAFLAKTELRAGAKVRELSKGMIVQLHLALVMAIDAKLLVLDEPTLGLDLVYRRAFYDALLGDYFDRNRTIIVATHEVDEIQNVLTDFVFLARGRTVLSASMADFETRFVELMAAPAELDAARALKPVNERDVLGRTILLFDGVERGRLAALGETRTPTLGDLFLSVMAGEQEKAA